MRIAALVFAFFAVSACSPKTETAETPANPKPAWVQSRPTSGMFYTGIGVSQKNVNTDFQRTARESALSDLASEIKVNVSSNSLLYTLEREYKFEQEFRETVQVTSDLNLEEFEMVDTWEDTDSYWVYYRLNKQSYADRQREKKNAAESLALDFYAKGLSEESALQRKVSPWISTPKDFRKKAPCSSTRPSTPTFAGFRPWNHFGVNRTTSNSGELKYCLTTPCSPAFVTCWQKCDSK